jgi:hypothetical protein
MNGSGAFPPFSATCLHPQNRATESRRVARVMNIVFSMILNNVIVLIGLIF